MAPLGSSGSPTPMVTRRLTLSSCYLPPRSHLGMGRYALDGGSLPLVTKLQTHGRVELIDAERGLAVVVRLELQAAHE